MSCFLPALFRAPSLGCDPATWVSTLAAVCAVAAVAASAVLSWRAWKGGRSRWVAAVVPLLVALAGWCLAVASTGLWHARGAGQEGRHVVAVVDVSASARRTPEQLTGTLARAAERLEDAGRASRPADTAGVVLAADGVTEARRRLPLAGLAGVLPGLAAEAGPAEGQSDLAAGITEAVRQIQAAGGGGAVLLVSDGLETRGDGAAAAEAAGRLGIPVHTLPAPSPAPGIGLVASHLPHRVTAGTRTRLRMVIANPLPRPAAFHLRVRLNGEGEAAETTATIPAEGTGAASLPVEFSGRGLQFADAELTPVDGGAVQHRRLYTQVDAPARIGVIGPAGWLAGLPAASYRLERLADGAAFAVADLDVVVVDGVPADRLAPGQAERIAEAVRGRGLGFLLVNGPQRGGDEAPTVLKSYEDTALDPLLPLSSKPRDVMVEPPGRQVVIMVDTSGSMCDGRLALAQQVAARIVDQLRPRDTLTVTAFASGFADVLPATLIGTSGKARALAAIGGLACGGGTDPNSALQRLNARDGRQCGLFFISDGEFDLQSRQPGCMTTVFAIDQTAASVNRAIFSMGEVHLVNRSGDAAGVTLGFFSPEKRSRTFEPGRYRPDDLLPQAGLLPDPPDELDGTAVSFPRERVDLAATRPYPVDPVLAFLDGGAGTAGAFTTEVPAAWAADRGARAVEAWMERLTAWPRRDRYIIELSEDDGAPVLLVSLAVTNGQVPLIEHLSASLRGGSGGDTPLRSESDPGVWGRFRIRLPDSVAVGAATLVLRETGRDALGREQRIPIRLGDSGKGAAAAGSEQWSFGVNAPLLRTIAAASGGVFDPPASVLAGAALQPPRAVPLWPWFLAAAAALYVTMIAVWRWCR